MGHSGRYFEGRPGFARVTLSNDPQVGTLLRSLPLRGALLLGALLLLPASAHAAQITGDPLSISSDDDTGRLGAVFTGSQSGEFLGSFADSQTGTVSPAGQ